MWDLLTVHPSCFLRYPSSFRAAARVLLPSAANVLRCDSTIYQNPTKSKCVGRTEVAPGRSRSNPSCHGMKRIREWGYPYRGHLIFRFVPPTPAPRLRQLLRSCCADLRLPPPGPEVERRLLRAARGRPGWILQCSQLQTQARYWRDERLCIALLCTDTEMALRQGILELLSAGDWMIPLPDQCS